MEYQLNRLAEILDGINSENANWLRETLVQLPTDPAQLYAALNSKRMWGGAGSVANDAMADNPGIVEWEWENLIREFRDLMIDIATELKARGPHYPDIDFWLSSFTTWNA